MKNMNLIYAVMTPPLFTQKLLWNFSGCSLLDEKNLTGRRNIQKIKMMISYCNDWMEDVFDGILKDELTRKG